MKLETIVKSKMKSNIRQFILGIFSLAVISVTTILPMTAVLPMAYAQTNGDAGGFVPCGNTASDPCNIGHLFKGFIVIINYLIMMAGFVAVLFIIISGFKMVWSQGDEGGLKTAKGNLSGAITGLVIVAAAYILINALLAGSLSIGVCNGGTILTDPKAYIMGSNSCS